MGLENRCGEMIGTVLIGLHFQNYHEEFSLKMNIQMEQLDSAASISEMENFREEC